MVIVGNRELSISDFDKVVFGKSQVKLETKALENLNANFEFLKVFAKDKVIYGINTGFGPMAQYRIDDDKIQILQYNLIRSHCSGAGDPLSHENVRSVMLSRLNTLMLGKS